MQKAEKAVTAKKQSVQQIEASLAAANARLDEASTAAEMAFERYNGAKWELEEARKASRAAQTRSAQAAADVARQRGGIAQLVTESYQNGTELNTASALLSDEGPQGLMNRYGVVQSAGDSMEARYDAFRAASARAKTLAAKAATAEKKQQSLAADARKLATAAGQAAAAASAAANEIAVQKQQLIEELAKAQNISVALATRRHDALERIARQKAAAAAQAKEAAEQAALQKAAAEAKKKAKDAKPDQSGLGRWRPGWVVERRLRRWIRPAPRLQPGAQPVGRDPARHRLRQGAAGQALPVGRRRSEPVRLLRPDDDGLGPGRQVAAALLGRAVLPEHAGLDGRREGR